MDELKIDELERIPIPEGLEERLSMKIDEWERDEMNEAEATNGNRSKLVLLFHNRYAKMASVAALLLVVFGIGLYLNHTPKGETDTFTDPQMARAEAEKAIGLFAEKLNKGFEAYAEANKKAAHAQKILNKYYN